MRPRRPTPTFTLEGVETQARTLNEDDVGEVLLVGDGQARALGAGAGRR